MVFWVNWDITCLLISEKQYTTLFLIHIYVMHVRFGDRQQWHTSHDSKSAKQSPKNNKFLGRKASSAPLYTETKILNLIIALNNCMFVFDHLNSSLSTIFDDLFKPFNEQLSHNTRGTSRYVSNILTKMKTVKRHYFDQQGYFDHIQIL